MNNWLKKRKRNKMKKKKIYKINSKDKTKVPTIH